MTDHLELSDDTQDELTEELQKEVAWAAEVDVDNPGFASLLTLLLEARAGEPDLPTLAVYLDALAAMLDSARDRLASWTVDEALRPQAAPALAATQVLLDRLEAVLCSSWAYLQHDDEAELEGAVSALTAVQADTQAAFAAHRRSG